MPHCVLLLYYHEYLMSKLLNHRCFYPSSSSPSTVFRLRFCPCRICQSLLRKRKTTWFTTGCRVHRHSISGAYLTFRMIHIADTWTIIADMLPRFAVPSTLAAYPRCPSVQPMSLPIKSSQCWYFKCHVRGISCSENEQNDRKIITVGEGVIWRNAALRDRG